ncbi:MAG: FHA domain-containing protein [Bryobacteraceae bacterium]
MTRGTGAAYAPRRIRVGMNAGGDGQWLFDRTFRIGRRDDVEVSIQSEVVSRVHCEVSMENGAWWVRDMRSANGIFVNGERVASAPVTGPTAVRLGSEGPWVYFDLEAPPPPPPPPSPPPPPRASAPPAEATIRTGAAAPSNEEVARAISRYFGGAGDGPAGDHTMVMRKAYAQVQQKQKRKYHGIFAALAVCILGAAAYAWYLHRQVGQQTALALELFYTMKSLDVDIAGLQKLVKASGTPQGEEELRKYRSRRETMGRNYDNFLSTLQVYDKSLTPQKRLILRVARIFGESELAMPPEFVSEVENYIRAWQGSDRMAKAIRRAQDNGYVEAIANELLAQGLPPQFLYLAMQESNFDPFISGPETRSGIAKGMWQFVPETALKYGLHIGPLADLPRPDPSDDRHHWDRATTAAAAYLQDLYRTEAQGSGFLVMACYNWGEDRVLPLVRKMPPNPKERNFWRLLAMGKERLPEETYKYVFYIASAAVIGEDPRLFGFEFDNPLGFLEKRK